MVPITNVFKMVKCAIQSLVKDVNTIGNRKK